MNAKTFFAFLFILLISIVATFAIVYDFWGYVLVIVIGSLVVIGIVHAIQHMEQPLPPPRRRQTVPRTKYKPVNEEKLRNWVEEEFDKASTYDNPESYR